MRQFLYSKWFFGILGLVCAFNLAIEIVDYVDGCSRMSGVAIPMDLVAVLLTGWMFLDLRDRHPKYGGNSSGR
jgi:hypothetical protein